MSSVFKILPILPILSGLALAPVLAFASPAAPQNFSHTSYTHTSQTVAANSASRPGQKVAAETHQQSNFGDRGAADAWGANS